MSEFDPFQALTKPWSKVTIHNVLLLDVHPTDDGFEKLVVQHDGRSREVLSGSRWSAERSRRDVNLYGHLVPAKPIEGWHMPPGSSWFRPYIDQSLRRVPELDQESGERGWCCDAAPRGLLAPAGLIPGKDGAFVPDETVEVTVRVPPEFVQECRRVQRTPKQLLEGFIADAAGIVNLFSCPRSDGFGSNGSDERDLADAWIQRAYGMDAVDLDELEAAKDDEEQRQLARDDFAAFLDDFVAYGGAEGELRAAVLALVEQQRAKNEVAETGPQPGDK